MGAKSRLGRGLDGLLGKGLNSSSNNTQHDTAKNNTNSTLSAENDNSNRGISEQNDHPQTATKMQNKKPKNSCTEKQNLSNNTKAHTIAHSEITNKQHDTHDSNILQEININYIIPSSSQARQDFDEHKIIELANSIKEGGLLQPIVVKSIDTNKYMIIAGERRYRALKYLGIPTALVRIIASEEKESAILSLAENLQRESLNPIEEAQGFAYLASEFGLTQEQIAQKVGKARTTIANSIRLLSLEAPILSAVRSGKISVGHAKILLSIDNLPKREEVFHAIITKDLNVRQTENLALLISSEQKPATSSPKELSESLIKIEKQLAQQLTANVSLQHSSTKGKIVIEYKGEDELLRIANRIGVL